VAHERLEDVGRNVGVGTQLCVGVPEGVGEDALAWERRTVLVDELADRGQPLRQPVAERRGFVGVRSRHVAPAAPGRREQQHLRVARVAGGVEPVRPFAAQVRLPAWDDSGVCFVQRQHVAFAGLLHPVDQEGVGALFTTAIGPVDGDGVPVQAVEAQVAQLLRSPPGPGQEFDQVPSAAFG
jgi:hypothetical protein